MTQDPRKLAADALREFCSGAKWGKRMAWIVGGAPTREQGIAEAQQMVREQMKADEALAAIAASQPASAPKEG